MVTINTLLIKPHPAIYSPPVRPWRAVARVPVAVACRWRPGGGTPRGGAGPAPGEGDYPHRRHMVFLGRQIGGRGTRGWYVAYKGYLCLMCIGLLGGSVYRV